jgi:hypothetical protein
LAKRHPRVLPRSRLIIITGVSVSVRANRGIVTLRGQQSVDDRSHQALVSFGETSRFVQNQSVVQRKELHTNL